MQDEEPTDEELRIQRKERIDSAVERAKKNVAAMLRKVKDPTRKQKLGATTAEDDIGTIHQLIDGLAVGLDVAIDTDADPATVMESLSWEEFRELFPQEVSALVAHIPDLKDKLPTDRAVNDQVEACFSVAKEAMERALKGARLGGGGNGAELGR